jgi:hypothetical protein
VGIIEKGVIIKRMKRKTSVKKEKAPEHLGVLQPSTVNKAT